MNQRGSEDILSPAFDTRHLPPMLNVLTILTFVGCALSYVGTLVSFALAGVSYRMMNTASTDTNKNEMPDFMKSLVQMFAHSSSVYYRYRFLFLAVALVTTSLCLWGAIQMRQFKRQGFYLYITGELAYPALYSLMVGIGGFAIFSLIVPIAFVCLYATQRKHLDVLHL